MTDALMFPYTASNVKEIEAFKVVVSLFPFSTRATKFILLYLRIKNIKPIINVFMGKILNFHAMLTIAEWWKSIC